MRYITNTKRIFPVAIAVGVLPTAVLAGVLLVASHRGPNPGSLGMRPSPVTDPSPVPTAAVTLVEGAPVADGIELGYPHTVVGAISDAAEYLDAVASTLDPDYAASLMRTAGDPATASLPTNLAHSTVLLRGDLQLPVDGPLPVPVSFRTVAQMYQLRDVQPDSALVLVLATGTFANAQGESAQSLGVFPVRMHWTGGDWRLADIGGTAQNYSDLAATPGTSAAVGRAG